MVNKNSIPTPRSTLAEALGIAWNFGFTVAVPLVLFALAGRFLDRRLHTHPWFFLAGALLAILTSTVLLVRKFKQLLTPTK